MRLTSGKQGGAVYFNVTGRFPAAVNGGVIKPLEQSQHSVFIFLLGEDNSELRAIILKVLFLSPDLSVRQTPLTVFKTKITRQHVALCGVNQCLHPVVSHNPSVTWIDQLDTSFPTGLEGALTDQYKCGPHQ